MTAARILLHLFLRKNFHGRKHTVVDDMKTRSASILISVVLSITGSSIVSGIGGEPEALPLPHAHAHNDYEHSRPLLDALERGFCSVEADIHLVDGKLLVAHDRDKVAEERTLEALYLNPLRARSMENGGRVYRNGPSVLLLIDIKSEAESTYVVLRKVLREYESILTTFSEGGSIERAVTVVISGNRPKATIAKEKVRHAAIDGRLPDLGEGISNQLIPLISSNWSSSFEWRGIGEFSETGRERLKGIVQRAHSEGRKIRFWNTPDFPEAWKELANAGVDLINTDNLRGLSSFLRSLRGVDEQKRL